MLRSKEHVDSDWCASLERAIDRTERAQEHHEVICNERLMAIMDKLTASGLERENFRRTVMGAIDNIYSIMWKAAFGIICALFGLTVTLVVKFAHL